MGEKEWLHLKIVNNTDRPLTIKELYFHWGRLYDFPNKGSKVAPEAVNNQTIESGSSFALATVSDGMSGTEGELKLLDGSTQVMKVYWHCPYIGENNFATYYVKDGYFPSNTAWSKSGELGTITLTIFKS